MRTRGAVAILVAVLGGVPAGAGEGPRCTIPRAGDWREYRSAHFVVATDVSRTAALSLVRELERTRALVVQALFGEQVEIPGRLRVVAFGDPRRFRTLAGEYVDAYVGETAAGPIAVLQFVGGGVLPGVVAHELAHHVSWFIFPRQPRWFMEGLAEFVATVGAERIDASPATGSHIVRGARGGGRWAGLASDDMVRAAQGDIVPARELLAWKNKIDKGEPWRHHLSSWLLYHWLWNERSKQLAAFQERLSRGDDPAAAWREAFPEYDPANPDTLSAIDDELARYRKLGRYASYRVEVAAFDTRFSEGPISSADLHMLLLDARRSWPEKPDDAKALARAEVDEALREDPGHPLAMARRASAPGESAVAPLRAAAAARPADARAWLLLASSLDAKTDAKEKEAAYRKAVALAPDSASANNGLAWLLVQSGRAREARPFADRALDLAPWDPDVIDTLAAVAVGIGQCKAAVQLERRAADHFAADDEGGKGFRERAAEYEAKCGAEVPKPR